MSRSSRRSRATASATRSKVARDAIAEARRALYDVVVVDTAGRLGIDAELMQQAADIRDAVEPDEILFVVDAMIGQDAVTTAQAFLDGVGFTGVVLSKLDGDARGGAALSVAQVTGRQVMFASNGEKLTDFDVFHPDRMASRILGMGDMLTLIEQAEKAFDVDQATKAAAKLRARAATSPSTTSSQQMQAVRKMGSLSKIMGMMPGMGQFKDQIENFDEREIDRVQAMILSMTPAERANPKMIDGSRRARIAKGSGRAVSEINVLVDRFFEARKMMMSMAGGGGMPGMPGLPGMAGKRTKSKQQAQQGRKKRGSGNPAKRAAAAEGHDAGIGCREAGRRGRLRLRQGRERRARRLRAPQRAQRPPLTRPNPDSPGFAPPVARFCAARAHDKVTG